jgi:hypothetical protein
MGERTLGAGLLQDPGSPLVEILWWKRDGKARSAKIHLPEKRTWTHVNDLRVVVAAERSVDDVSFASVKESAISIRLRTRCRIPSGTLGNKSEKDR